MNESSNAQDECIRKAADQLFIEAKHVNEFTQARVLDLAGGNLGRRDFERVFPGHQFSLRRQSWLRQRIENAMETTFFEAKTQQDFTMQHIADLAGCSLTTVKNLAGAQYYARRKALPDLEQQMLQTIARLVEAKIPLQEFTWKRVYAEGGSKFLRFRDKINQAFEDGYETLRRHHEQQKQQRVPGATHASIQGNWINLEEPAWYLPPLRKTLRRDRLRPDIAAVAWPLLREEALTASPSAGTLSLHYDHCLALSKILGDVVPDIRALTLAALQQAWIRSEASVIVRQGARTMLMRMLEALITQSAADGAQNLQGYAFALQWLRTLRLRESPPAKSYLSEEEFDHLIDCSLQDTLQGLAYMQRLQSASGQEVVDLHARYAEPVLNWGGGLIILIMAFTGLRRQSIVRLNVEDIAQIGPDVFALVWRHGKPGKQLVAVIPALVAEYLQYYISVTKSVRTYLGTQQIFFARNPSNRWDEMTVQRLDHACKAFASRHGLTHDGSPLRLGSTLLRRTYVTRALYELPNIAALQAQLGHNDAKTTLGYAQHDRFEHPDQVDGALDAFGRKVLARWYKPLLLDDLPDAKRKALLAARITHEQDVGMCLHDCCVKLDENHLPPCSLCEHLLSGSEYLSAWEREKVRREQQLERFAQTPGAELLLAQMKGQYNRFLTNYQFVKERSHL